MMVPNGANRTLLVKSIKKTEIKLLKSIMLRILRLILLYLAKLQDVFWIDIWHFRQSGRRIFLNPQLVFSFEDLQNEVSQRGGFCLKFLSYTPLPLSRKFVSSFFRVGKHFKTMNAATRFYLSVMVKNIFHTQLTPYLCMIYMYNSSLCPVTFILMLISPLFYYNPLIFRHNPSSVITNELGW